MSNSKIKLDIISHTFEGKESSKCDNGGIALFDYKLESKLFHETTTICNEHNQDQLTSKRAFYSTLYEMIIVGYEYKEYSSATLNASVSKTHCKVTQINTCILTYLETVGRPPIFSSLNFQKNYRFQLQSPECVILQFSSNRY